MKNLLIRLYLSLSIESKSASVEQMPAAPAVRRTKPGYGQRIHVFQFLGHLTLPFPRTRHNHRPNHDRPARQIVNVPAQGFVLASVPRQTCRQTPLSTSDIEVQARLKRETAELTHVNPAANRQVENRNICAALQHNGSIAQLILPDKGSQHNPFARPAVLR